MDLTTFQYITVIPDSITNADWYALACRSFNLGLTFFWFVLLIWILDLLFTCLSKFYKKGRE